MTDGRNFSAEDIARGIGSFMVRFGYASIRHDPKYNARGPVREILSRYRESQMTACPHVSALELPPGLSRVKRPEVVLWAAWKPDLLVCHDCRFSLALSDETENHRCDGCGTVEEFLATGPSVIEAENPGMPPLVCAYGLCKKCAEASGLRGE